MSFFNPAKKTKKGCENQDGNTKKKRRRKKKILLFLEFKHFYDKTRSDRRTSTMSKGTIVLGSISPMEVRSVRTSGLGTPSSSHSFFSKPPSSKFSQEQHRHHKQNSRPSSSWAGRFVRHNTVTKSKSNVAVTAIISPAGVGGGGQGDAQKMLLEEELGVKSMYALNSKLKTREVFGEHEFVVMQKINKSHEVVVKVTTNGVKYCVTIETTLDCKKDNESLFLHWGVAQDPNQLYAFNEPPMELRPENTRPFNADACQTLLKSRNTRDRLRTKGGGTIEISGDVCDSVHAINFVIRDENSDQWFKPQGGDSFHVKIPTPPPPIVEVNETFVEEEIDVEEMEEMEVEIEDEPIPPPPPPPPTATTTKMDASDIDSSEVVSAGDLFKRIMEREAEKRRRTKTAVQFGSMDFSNNVSSLRSMDSSNSATVTKNKIFMRDGKKYEKKMVPRIVKTKVKKRVLTEIQVPAKLVEGPWIDYGGSSSKIFLESENAYRIGALVEGNSLSAFERKNGAVTCRIETNIPDDVHLHWGIVPRGGRSDLWTAPPEAMRPPETRSHDDQAVQTPLKRVTHPLLGSHSFIELDLNIVSISQLRFCLLGKNNTWFDNSGQGYSIQLPELQKSESKLTPQQMQESVSKKIEETEQKALLCMEAAEGTKESAEKAFNAYISALSKISAAGDASRFVQFRTLVDEVGEKYLELVRTVGLASSIAQAAADDLQISYEEQMDMFGTTEVFYASAFASLTVPENEVLNESSVRAWYDGVVDAISKAEKKAEAVQRGLISLKKDLELQIETEKAEVQKNEADEKMRVLKRQAEAARTRAKDIDIVKLGLPQKTTTEKKKGTGGREILLQGFHWDSTRVKDATNSWYAHIHSLLPKIKEYGFNTVWLPPPTDSVSAEGYMPRDLYTLDSKYGTEEELRDLVKAFHDVNIIVLGDAVLNHRCAHAQGPDGLWNKFGGKLDWDERAIVCNDPNFGGKGNHGEGDCIHCAPNIDHSQDFVKKDITEWLQFMRREIGFDGWRLDYVKGFGGRHVSDYIEGTEPEFSVGEYWDSLSYQDDGKPCHPQDEHRGRIVKWIEAADPARKKGAATGSTGQTNPGAFDVTLKGILHAVMEYGEYWRLSHEGKPSGLLGWWSSRAVTFIENHDTGSSQGHWRFPSGTEMQGYAYILTHPGTPCVFWDHIFEDGWSHLHKPIRDLLAIRKKMDIHYKSDVEIVPLPHGTRAYAAKIDDCLYMKIGPDDWSPPQDGTIWDVATFGENYCVWVKNGSEKSSGPR